MERRDVYLNISPLDQRYWVANSELFDSLAEYLSESAVVRYMVKAELALLRVYINEYLDKRADLLAAVNKLADSIHAEAVEAEERLTNHNVRALVNVIQRRLPDELKPWVHMGATSADITESSTAMRIRDGMRKVVIPLLLDLLDACIRITEKEADTPQAGRTHGQLAVPITFGFAIAEYVSRLGQSLVEIERLSKDLRGKLSGAVGAYNAISLVSREPEKLEAVYLRELGLKCPDYSNQLVEPEHLLRLLLELNTAFGIIANLADDLRHLQRSEIGELSEGFEAEQVGSSTMPQKRNPWNCEHVKSLWKAFSPRVLTFYLDQISEHQRDLTNSASGRFIADYIAGFAAAATRMHGILSKLVIRRDRMAENLRSIGDGILAEPCYILLAVSGISDAHERIKQATLIADSSKRSLRNVLKKNEPDLWKTLCSALKLHPGRNARDFFDNPREYRGLASLKAKKIAKRYAEVSAKIRGMVNEIV